jgi:hypothetical protein
MKVAPFSRTRRPHVENTSWHQIIQLEVSGYFGTFIGIQASRGAGYQAFLRGAANKTTGSRVYGGERWLGARRGGLLNRRQPA